jgi:DNA-binding NtrC family response regulator
MKGKVNILIIEDDYDGRLAIADALKTSSYNVEDTATGKEGLEKFITQEFDVVIVDIRLPDISGFDVLKEIKAINPDIPVILITAFGKISDAITALKSGAYDYILKPLELSELLAKVEHAAEMVSLKRQVDELKDTFGIKKILGKSEAINRVKREILLVANSNAGVLILGESGTGKELVAKAIHYESKRAKAPFVAINCGAFSETLLESELFGHEKGAFSGAISRRQGAFEKADSGTIFLDEIGAASKNVQTRLLRVLEEKEIMRLGSSETIKIDVRVISATNNELEELIATQNFREDLLYRLKVVTIHVPPLRERKEDIRILANAFLAQAIKDNNCRIDEIKESYFVELERYSWPGNVRELKNVVEASVLLSKESSLDENSLIYAMGKKNNESQTIRQLILPENLTIDELEKEAILQALKRNKGNRALTAEQLGISVKTVQRKIKEHNLPF